jgi:large subunit ribosomal protein L9
MQVILLRDVPGVGKKNELRDVNGGYAKNFLLAKNLAVIATPQVVSKMHNEAHQAAEKSRRENERAAEAAADLTKRTFTFVVKVGDKGQVFGTIHERDVAEKISAKLGVTVDRKQVTLPKDMKHLGEYTAEVKLGGTLAHPKILLTK